MAAVRRTCPAWLASGADDVVQAALLRVLSLCREGAEEPPPSYLTKVAYSCLIDEIRRMRRRREVALEEADAAPSAAGTDPERARMGSELRGALHDCLGELVEARRVAVTLHLQGHSVPEATRILGWPAKTTENRVYRGLADLRRCLSAKGFRP